MLTHIWAKRLQIVLIVSIAFHRIIFSCSSFLNTLQSTPTNERMVHGQRQRSPKFMGHPFLSRLAVLYCFLILFPFVFYIHLRLCALLWCFASSRWAPNSKACRVFSFVPIILFTYRISSIFYWLLKEKLPIEEG